MWLLLLLANGWQLPELSALRCPAENAAPLQFQLVRQCQRAATAEALALESTPTLEACMKLARELRGLALNYAPGGPERRTNRFEQQPRDAYDKEARKRLTVSEQPAEYFNCHVLQCPQNISFAGMLNDSRFDYYSLYGRPTGKRAARLKGGPNLKANPQRCTTSAACRVWDSLCSIHDPPAI